MGAHAPTACRPVGGWRRDFGDATSLGLRIGDGLDTRVGYADGETAHAEDAITSITRI